MSFFSPAKNIKSKTKHELMLAVGLIQQIGSGTYAYLPEGLKLIKKIESLCRSHMLEIGCEEVVLPVLNNLELLKKTGRRDIFGKTVFTLKDKSDKDFFLAPTHEEVMIQLFKKQFEQKNKSANLLPTHLIQFQTKFRDELRPRGGLIRSKEFLMQDSYSFHETTSCLEDTFQKTKRQYEKIFQKLQLDYIAVEASTGSMGGTKSIEFQLLAEEGEDTLLISENGYASNIEVAQYITQKPLKAEDSTFEKVESSRKKEKNRTHNVSIYSFIQEKTKMLTHIVLLKQDILHPDKVFNYLGKHHAKLTLPYEIDLQKDKFLIDFSVAATPEIVCSLGRGNYLSFGNYSLCDLRYPRAGDLALDGGKLRIAKGIEIGHIFQLGDRYSKPLELFTSNNSPVFMGCYGIGISRLLTACIIQHSTLERLILPKVLRASSIRIIAQTNDQLCQDLFHSITLHLDSKTQEKWDIQISYVSAKNTIKETYDSFFCLGVNIVIILRTDSIDLFDLDIAKNREDTSMKLSFSRDSLGQLDFLNSLSSKFETSF